MIMTYLFKLIGSGDTMTGMEIMMYAFMGIVLIIVLIVLALALNNYLAARKKASVSLKSKAAEKKKEVMSKGLFNYDIISGDENPDGTVGLDPTDPNNQKGRKKRHQQSSRNHVQRKGLKPVEKKIEINKANTPKVGLRRNGTQTAPAPVPQPVPIASIDDNDYESISFDGGNPNQGYDAPLEPSAAPQPQQSMPAFDDNSGTFNPADFSASMDDEGIQIMQTDMPASAPRHAPRHAAPPVQPSVPAGNAYNAPQQNPVSVAPQPAANPFIANNAGNPFASPINPDDVSFG